MQHLPIERLAELADSELAGADAEHVETCERCARELAAYRRVVAIAADERRRIAPPLTNWASLSAALRTEGMVAAKADVGSTGGTVRSVPPSGSWSAARRAAAAVVFLGAGLVAGRMSAGLSVREAVVFGAPSVAADAGSAALASDADASDFDSQEQALEALRLAQLQYERAAAFLASYDTSTTLEASEQYRTRLAALDQSAETFARALQEAPEDPILNQYYLSALGAREATLSKLGGALPVGVRLTRF